MIFASWNVNGLRSVSGKGFENWFNLYNPDVIALQEIKATKEDVSTLIKTWSDRYSIHLNPAVKKGYSGTALLIKNSYEKSLIKLERGLGGADSEQFDNEGRLIWAEFENIILINGYFPNGQRDHSRVEFKLNFSRKVFDLAHGLHKKTKKEIIITGDLNTAHHEIDLANPKANSKTTGFLPNERAFIDEVINEGFIDIFRHFHPGIPDQYTWWTYRGDCRERNIGWRLDYFFSTKNLLNKVVTIDHQTEILGSDHCPILLEIKD